MGRRSGPPVCLAFLLIATVLEAAPEAILRGKVLDGAGLPLPGATVVVVDRASGQHEQGTITDSQGAFRFPALAPGSHYELTVSLPGFTTIVITDLSLEPGQTLEHNVVLPAGDFKETVRVKGRTQTLETEKVTASTTFTSTFIAELPILGRDYKDLLTLAPGVTDVNNTGNPNIHGARDTDVVTLVDGVSTTDPLTGHYGQNLNIESIQELEVITSAATAQFSRAQGGFANILTKSGGNEFQGTFKMFVRSDRLDGDGAGTENPELIGGLQEERDLRGLHFTDLMPFLSLSGPLIRDRLWYYLTAEYIHEETPVNALSQMFVTPTYGYRNFLKTTWQVHPAHRLAFSVLVDEERHENLGLNSLTSVESGYTASRGGPTLTLRETAIFSPDALLESTLSWFDNRFSRIPTTDPDTNRNGMLYLDGRPDLGGNGDGILQASERDPGEDWDGDGFYDIFEDVNFNGIANNGEDLDHDGWIRDVHSGCEGTGHEDLNCNGRIDSETDANLNGRVDPAEDVGIPYDCIGKLGYCPAPTEAGTRGNGRFDTEDRNGNGRLDVVGDSGPTPVPFWSDTDGDGIPEPGEFRSPLPADRQFFTDAEGRTSGPQTIDYHDHRKRLTWREDASLFVPEALGTHDLKVGGVYEHEGYDADIFQRSSSAPPTRTLTATHFKGSPRKGVRPGQRQVILGIPALTNNTATGDNLGLYLQDTWKPFPNLTLGLGLRFDYENLYSYGYTLFDPAAEHGEFASLMQAAGLDLDGDDRLNNQGLCRDPLRSCSPNGDPYVGSLAHQLITAAFGRLTRHQRDVQISSQFLGDLTGGGNNDLDEEIAYARHARAPEDFTITNSNLAPRLSLSWDPWSDGKTMIFASWGRYYDKLFLGSLVLEQGPDTVVRGYESDHDGVNDQGYPDSFLGKPFSQSPLSAFQVDRSLATPYSVEWTAGFRRELAPEVLVSLRYIHRDYEDQLQDVDLNHQVVRDPYTGAALDRLGTTICLPQVSESNICERVPNGAPDLAIQNFLFNRVYRLGNFNEQTYRAWELEFARRLKRRWQLEASYTYSIARGDAESFRSILGNDPSLAELEPGYLDYDQRHVVKLGAVAFLPGDWRLGGTATWASGLPYSSVSYYADQDDAGFSQGRLIYGQLGPDGYGFTPEARNVHRNPASYLFNARVMKSFVIDKASASAFLEVYNLLNADNLRVHQVQQIPVQLIYLGLMGPVIFPPQVSVQGERDFGRRFQVGFQIDF